MSTRMTVKQTDSARSNDAGERIEVLNRMEDEVEVESDKTDDNRWVKWKSGISAPHGT